MLTTDTSYRWCDTKERKLELMGAVLVAVMCETSKIWNMAKASSSLAKITKTGFVDAVKKAKQKKMHF